VGDTAVGAADAAGGPPVDFSGRWLNTDIEGDAATFFKDGAEESWARRKAMSLAGYGVARLVHTITMGPGSAVTTTLSGGPRVLMVTHHADGQEHSPPPDNAGRVHRYVARWEGAALVTRSVGGSTFDMRRTLAGGRMRLELSFPAKGLSITRVFEKQTDAA
jgi:hypothetical protein